MSTSVIGTTLDALRAGLLDVLPPQVNVFTGKVTYDDAGLECIILGGECRMDEEAMAMGGARMETWTVDCQLRVFSNWQGTTEATIKHARDRALVLFGLVETYVNDTYVGTLPDVEVSGPGNLANDIDSSGRVCWLGFELTVRADKNP